MMQVTDFIDMQRLVAPSMLSADFLNLEKDVAFVNKYADIFHLDVMDGIFVPNISYGFPVIEAIAKKAAKPMDAHLMITYPEKYIERFVKAGASMVSFHLEAAMDSGTDPVKILSDIKGFGARAGMAIDPDVPVEKLFPYIEYADFMLIMSVFAGFGGQKFIEDTYKRISDLKNEIERRNSKCMIEVDGGVSPANADRLVECGAEILVAGSSIFKAEDRAEVARKIRGQII